MPFKLEYSKEELSGPKPVPPGLYVVQFDNFAPAWSKDKLSYNLNLNTRIISDNPDWNDKKVRATLNSKIPGWIQDCIHSFGVEMANQDGDRPSFPGTFEADPSIFKENDPSTWRYAGPLVGKTAHWELSVRQYQGRDVQEVRRFMCSVNDCTVRFPFIRHSEDMTIKKD